MYFSVCVNCISQILRFIVPVSIHPAGCISLLKYISFTMQHVFLCLCKVYFLDLLSPSVSILQQSPQMTVTVRNLLDPDHWNSLTLFLTVSMWICYLHWKVDSLFIIISKTAIYYALLGGGYPKINHQNHHK